MKAFVLGCGASLVLALAVMAQTPTVSPDFSPPTTSPAATISPAAAASPAPSIAAAPTATSPNEFAENIKRKVQGKHRHGVHIEVNGHDGADADGNDGGSHEDFPEALIPVVAIAMLSIFGMPVAIVAVIMLISWAKTRSLHRTVRTMVEKGQPVPPELLASPAGAPLRPWYDLRRGIVLLAVGVGVVMFFGISAGWDEGVWALGLIPALIGGGYILAWRLAQKQQNGFKV